MQKVSPAHTNFTGGELSPWLHGRFDVEKYINGAKTLENFQIRPQGPAVRRTGTYLHDSTLGIDLDVGFGSFEFTMNARDGAAIILNGDKARVYTGEIGVPATPWQQEFDFPLNLLGDRRYQVQAGNLVFVFSHSDEDAGDGQFVMRPKAPLVMYRNSSTLEWGLRGLSQDLANGPYEDPLAGDEQVSIQVQLGAHQAKMVSDDAEFGSLAPGDMIEYKIAGVRALAQVISVADANTVYVTPLEDLCYEVGKEVYSPGTYDGWVGSLPTYGTITAPATNETVAFSKTSVVSRDMLWNYLHFCDRGGAYFWMHVKGVGDIIQNGSYGILATGDILDPYIPTGNIVVSERQITATLISNEPIFCKDYCETGTVGEPTYFQGRWIRLNFPDKVLHARMVDCTDGAWQGECEVILDAEPPRELNYDLAPSYKNGGVTFDWQYGVFHNGADLDYTGLDFVNHLGLEPEWPTCACFHDGRFVMAGTYNTPDAVFLSKVDDYYNFAPCTQTGQIVDDSAITHFINADQVSPVRWLMSHQAILYGTESGEGRISSGSNVKAPITPTNITSLTQTFYGSEAVRPVAAGKAILHVQKGGQRVREVKYDYTVDQYVSRDLTIFSEHLFRQHGPVIQLSYYQNPNPLVVALMSDGYLAIMSYETEHEVYAWTHWKIGGKGISGTGESRVLALASVATANFGPTFFVLVNRDVPIPAPTWLERLQADFAPVSPTDFSKVRFLDGARTYENPAPPTPVTTLFDPLYANCTVDVIIDDQYCLLDQTFNPSGQITLPVSIPIIQKAYYGFRARAILGMLPIEVQGLTGTGQGKDKRIDHLVFRVADTMSFNAGPSEDKTLPVFIRTANAAMDQFTPMYTGDLRFAVNMPTDARSEYVIVMDRPYPISVLAILPEVTVNK